MTESAHESVIDVLNSDHRAVGELIADVTSHPDDTDELEARCERIVMDLVRHFVGEEQYLYPTIRERVENGDQLADDGLAEHREIEKLLRRLEKVDRDPVGVQSVLSDVASAFDQHVQRQQSVIFPALTRVAKDEELIQLGDDVLGAEMLAPTRPRPVIENPFLNKIASFATGWIDKVRDAYSRRGVVEDDES